MLPVGGREAFRKEAERCGQEGRARLCAGVGAGAALGELGARAAHSRVQGPGRLPGRSQRGRRAERLRTQGLCVRR